MSTKGKMPNKNVKMPNKNAKRPNKIDLYVCLLYIVGRKMSKIFKVESANWHKDVSLEVTSNDTYKDASMEAATIAVESFFKGAVNVDDIHAPHTIDNVITVKEKGTDYVNWLYAPVVVANAGYYKEAVLLKQKIIMDNYELWS